MSLKKITLQRRVAYKGAPQLNYVLLCEDAIIIKVQIPT